MSVLDSLSLKPKLALVPALCLVLRLCVSTLALMSLIQLGQTLGAAWARAKRPELRALAAR